MRTKVILPDSEIPRMWYNIQADLPKLPDPPLDPETGEPVKAEKLLAIFPPFLIEQEVSLERWIPIPEEVLKIYLSWRPTPLIRAVNFETLLNTKCRVYYKYEGLSPAGSHKPNTAIAQAYYNKKAGVKRLTTETGAGQWGSALCFGAMFFGIEATVYMVRVSYNQKPYRRFLMETWGGKVIPSPSRNTASGRAILESDPDSPGSLGIAISEAIEEAISRDDTNYCLGSVLNHVLLHQTIIGLEAKKQMEMIGEYPDIIIGCCGGGSNLAGISFPFILDKIAGKNLRIIATEPTVCPTLTKGVYTYDFGDTSKLTPLLKMYTVGHDFIPPGIYAGGLRYHGDAPLISLLYNEGIIEAVAYQQTEIFDASMKFIRSEGIIPAPESSHAIKAVIDECRLADEEGKEMVILFNLSGHGLFDLSAYDAYLSGTLEDFNYPEEKIRESIARLENLNKCRQ